jgi:putative tricarboxylic transport membrane protein
MMLDLKYVQGGDAPIETRNFRKLWAGALTVLKYKGTVLKSSIIGIGVGVMPAAGATVANILAYNEAKRASKNSEAYGHGSEEGLIAGETANNASQGGAMATMLALGIPGSSATAMLIGALMLHNLIPGPRLFLDHMPEVYAILTSTLIQQVVLLGVGLVFCYYAATVITIPARVLVPAIALFAAIGGFAGRNTLFDARLMLFFGLVGWLMKRNDYPPIATVLGIILAPIADRELIRINQMFSGNYSALLTRPITVVFFVLSIVSLAYPIYRTYVQKKN